jgi:hypothetical protein
MEVATKEGQPLIDNATRQQHIDMREFDRVKLLNPCPAVCWFNGLFKPHTIIRVLDISNGGMMFFSRRELDKKGCTIRIQEVLSIHGDIVWKEKLKTGFMYGFKADKRIKDEVIQDINDLESYMAQLKGYER